MKKWMLIVLFSLLLLPACKGKKKHITDEEGITPADFIEFFDDVKPPFVVADSSFEKKKKDTVSISYKTFTSLVPDTLLHPVFSKNAKPRIYPLGKIAQKNNDTYLLLKAISPSQKAAYVLVFNKDKKFVAGKLLLVLDNNPATEQSAVMDNRYSITTNRQYKAPDGRMMYKKAAYAYISSAEAFALILTETNEVETKKELINPIDTLARKNKLAGDYLQNRLNLVSVRDSKRPNGILFFVHFEKDGGACKGELKGEAKIVSPGKFVYRQPGDQCELTFNFSGNTVTIKEEGCGSHRDIKCFFEGSFTRKPPAKGGKPVKTLKK
jgi:nucleoside diphosphate kinase